MLAIKSNHMHYYSISNHPKEKVIYFLAFIAIAVASIADSLPLSIVSTSQGIFKPLRNIPAFTIFMIIYWWTNNYLWKVKILREIILIPDLNGIWLCNGKTLIKNGQPSDTEWTSEITIKQSWSKIIIVQKTKNNSSSSKSIAASLSHSPGEGYRLLYQYTNTPTAQNLDLKIHGGCSEIVFNEEIKRAEGTYFTDRHRSTCGSITLKKQD